MIWANGAYRDGNAVSTSCKGVSCDGAHLATHCGVVLRAVAFDRGWLQAGEFVLTVAALVVGAAILISFPSGRVAAVVLADGRETLVTSRVEAQPGPLAALLEVTIAPKPLTSNESIAAL